MDFLVKMRSFWGHLCAAQRASSWLVGVVLKTTASLWLFLRAVLLKQFDYFGMALFFRQYTLLHFENLNGVVGLRYSRILP